MKKTVRQVIGFCCVPLSLVIAAEVAYVSGPFWIVIGIVVAGATLCYLIVGYKPAAAGRLSLREQPTADAPGEQAGKGAAVNDRDDISHVDLELVVLLMLHQGLTTMAYLRRKLAGISTFLVLTAVGTIIADLTRGFVAGLLGWLVVAVVYGWWGKKAIKVTERVVEEKAHELGFKGDWNSTANLVAQQAFWSK